MQRVWVLVLLWGLAWGVAPAQAQLPVIDVANLTQNTISALESVMQTIQQVTMVIHMVTELTPMDGAIGGSYESDVGMLAEVLADGGALARDIGSLQVQIEQMFHPETAARNNSYEYQLRKWEMIQLVWQSRSYAVRAQSLMWTAQRTVDDLMNLLGGLSAMFGNLSSQRALGDYQAKLTQIAEEHRVTTTLYEQADVLAQMQEPVIIMSVERINRAILLDHPR
jgi:P-type conjugative transfer protein TrbJ